MQQTAKIFGQEKPSALTNTLLFSVTALHQVQTSIFVANQLNDYDRFTIAIVPGGGSPAAANYLAYATPLSANGVFAFSGIYLDQGDEVYVMSQGGNCSFTATGLDFEP